MSLILYKQIISLYLKKIELEDDDKKYFETMQVLYFQNAVIQH